MHWTSWYHCSNDTSVIPGIASPLKVFILGVPKHNTDAKVLIRHPTVWIFQSRSLGVEEVVPEEPTLHLVACWSWRWGWLSWGNPPFPSWKGDLQVIPISITAPWRFYPTDLVEDCWGCACSLWSAISWWRSSMSCHSSWFVRSPSSAWRWHAEWSHPGGGYQ